MPLHYKILLSFIFLKLTYFPLYKAPMNLKGGINTSFLKQLAFVKGKKARDTD